MQFEEAYQYITQSERRKQILLRIIQPLTAKQLSKLTEISLDACSYILWELAVYEVVHCLNKQARRSRLYWLTDLGIACHKKLREQELLPRLDYELPDVEWNLYGLLCFNHRSSVLGAIRKPIQPAAIKREARSQNPLIRMSTNNVRDVIRFFLEKGVVSKTYIKGKAHPRYQLTDAGRHLQTLLLRAEKLELKA